MDSFNIDNYLRISLTDVLLVCISTFLIVLIAKKFFWDKLLAYIQKRQDMIQDNIDSSVKIKEEAQSIKERYDEKMKNAGKEAHAILESARASAAQEKQQILNQTQDEVVRLKKQAQEDIERDKRNAQKDMKEAIGSVALEISKKLLKKEVDEQEQKKYIDDFIDEAGSAKW
ncbi:F0F1 ATP synthase subunit B [Faecalicoccus sp.]|uniref:F0F1 ATP synthase subunit B n=1 Tax=Faecalicoccus sp. TaxID=1971758 RepID=UPI00260F154D|nr:F0F1 ATP synthase subunit B [Faecalicoccus sp.]